MRFASGTASRTTRAVAVAGTAPATRSPPMPTPAFLTRSPRVRLLSTTPSNSSAIASSSRARRPADAEDAMPVFVQLSRRRSNIRNTWPRRGRTSARRSPPDTRSRSSGGSRSSPTFGPGPTLLGVSELARAVDLSRSTAHRYVATLTSSGTSTRTRRRGSTASGRACSTSASPRSTRWSCARSRHRTCSS